MSEWGGRAERGVQCCPLLVGLCCYLLTVEGPGRNELGSLSDPGIFQGPGDTVAFLLAAPLTPPPVLVFLVA